ncbi:MAG TPA: tetratricopeptide repeat protein [Candidatus Synoicihabitans sp.]|nr:tetratricopeptide repeat protein [Candidatus Synoicihabitans sp.]
MLGAVIVGGSVAAHHLWRQQQTTKGVVARLPPPPDLRRWPVEFSARVEAVHTALAQSRDPAAQLDELGRLYQANGFNAEATQTWRLLRTLRPDDPRPAYWLSDLRRQANDLTEARHLLEETVRLAPEYAPARLAWAQSLLEQRDFGAARSHLNRLLAVQPALAPAQQLLRAALAAESHTQPDQAGSWAHVTWSDPWMDELAAHCFDAARLQLLAAAHFRAGRPVEAVPLLTRAVRIAPEAAMTHDTLAAAYERSGQLEKARAALEAGRRQVPESWTLAVRLGLVLGQLERMDEAVATLKAAVTQWPEQADVQAALGHVLGLTGDAAGACDAFTAALEANPAFTEAEIGRAQNLVKLGRLAEASAGFARALEMRPDAPEALAGRTELAIRAGDGLAAEEAGARLFALQPNHAPTRRLYAGVQLLRGNLAARAGRMDEAEQRFQRGIEIDASLGLLHASLGMVQQTVGRTDAAIDSFQNYLAANPQEPDPYFMLGYALRAAGRIDEAEQTLTRGREVARAAGAIARAEQLERTLAPPLP